MIVDLFAGPGGWDEGLRRLGRTDVIGFEWDANACATREAAGHLTVRMDVADLEPRMFAEVDGLVASPPCQMFSTAGKMAGHAARRVLVDAVAPMLRGEDVRAAVILQCLDIIDADLRSRTAESMVANAVLALEPSRFVWGLRPKWVALEQVPAVLPVWEAMVPGLERLGYRAWCGNVDFADYGVPQHRRRALLLASLNGLAFEPPRTHGPKAPQANLFDPEPPPWVTMADALDWPLGLVGFARREDRPHLDDGSGYRARDLRSTDRPAQTVTEKARSWTRSVDVTEAEGQAFAERRRQQSTADVDLAWPWRRPATTVAGRALIADPGANANRFNGAAKSRNDGYRVEPHEAGVLQTFPADYPWRGSRTAQFVQIGNAIPPKAAAHVVACVMPTTLDTYRKATA